jgi:hypothetical protein
MALLAPIGTALAAQNVPLPRAKPADLNTQPAPLSAPILQEGEPTSANSPCSKILREIADFKPLPDITGPGECGASDRVQLVAVKMPDGSRVRMEPAATLRCPMAEAIAQWARGELGQAAIEHGSPLRAITAGTSYNCRPRNSVKGAKISEHGRGNAVDVTTIKLANGKVIDLTRTDESKAFREQARAGACHRFTTVLGPGADPHHEDHIHVDLAARSRGHRMCQWDVREPVVASAQPASPASSVVAPSSPRPPLVQARQPQANSAVAAQVSGGAQPPTPAAVPLPLRRPFELVFAMRKSPGD